MVETALDKDVKGTLKVGLHPEVEIPVLTVIDRPDQNRGIHLTDHIHDLIQKFRGNQNLDQDLDQDLGITRNRAPN